MTLTTEELADLRADVEAMLPSTCNVVTTSRTRDARGQVTEITVTGPDIPCSVDPVEAIPQEAIVEGRVGVVTGWRITLPLSTIVTESDLIGFDVEGRSGLGSVIEAAAPETEASARVLLVRELT